MTTGESVAVLTDDDRSFLLDVLDERGAIKRELAELGVVLQQNTTELESASQRHQRMQASLKEYEPRLESLSRDDFRKLITSVNQAELRYLLVREQHERLTEKHEAYAKLLLVLDYTLRIAPFAGLDVPENGVEMPRSSTARHVTEVPPAVPAAPVAPPEGDGAKGTPPAALARIIQAQEEERQRLARQMHDGPAQSMTNLILRAELCERLVKSHPDRAASELSKLKSLVNATLQETRQFIFDVRPMILDDLGLVPALKRYLAELREKSGPEVALTVKSADHRLPITLEIALYRIIQDALKLQQLLGNGHDSRIQLDLDISGTQAVVTVVYAQPIAAAVVVAGAAASQEYETIKQRASTVGGTVDIDTRGEHCVLRVLVPVAATVASA